MIPRFLDEPTRYLGMTGVEATAVWAPFLTCLFLDSILLGLFLALVGFIVAKNASGKFEKGGVQGFLYWHLPSQVLRFKRIPTSHQREWVG